MKPGVQRANGAVPTIDEVHQMESYEHVADQSVPVWPGGLSRSVFRHKSTGTLWARSIFLDDDSCEERGDWYEVERTERVIVSYEPLPMHGPRRPEGGRQ